MVVLEKILGSPLDSKEIQPVHPKGNQSWIFIESVVATHAGNKLTQKDDADSGVQFITLVGPRQSLLLAKDPNQFLWKPYIP